jgi:hypothetical protein
VKLVYLDAAYDLPENAELAEFVKNFETPAGIFY